MTDLTKNTTGFGLMDVEAQAAMQNCGGPWEVYGLDGWIDVTAPTWLKSAIYRQKPPIPDSIDWSHVHEDFICMARDSDDRSFFYTEKPRLVDAVWGCVKPFCKNDTHASYRRGTVDWRDSLVWRPGYGPEGEE